VSPRDSSVRREATSIKIDPQLWKEAKIEAIRREIDVSELVEDALRKELRSGNKEFEANSKLKGGRL
jgi:post-segregation antitoxin (ccd killing protein)